MSSHAAPSPLQIRHFEPDDWTGVWRLLEPVFRAGDTFPHDPLTTEAEARVSWVEQNLAVMVAVAATGAVVGTYYLRPNSLALGAHVANAGFVVAEPCRRQGIGSRLCRHSLLAALFIVLSIGWSGPLKPPRWPHRRQATGGAGGPEEGVGDGGKQPPGAPAYHQGGGVAQLISCQVDEAVMASASSAQRQSLWCRRR